MMPICAKIPEYFSKNGYKSPPHVYDGPFQYAFGTTETAFEYWAKDPQDAKNFNTLMNGGAHVIPP